jgi:iron complex outermembrane receptor protein
MTGWRRAFAGGCAAVLGCASPPMVRAAEDLADLDFEALAQVEITSVSRWAEPAVKVAAAATVLTGAEIVRLGRRTLPDTLRFVPGLFVGQINQRDWAVSARGFAAQFQNKLLVLADGRPLYTPLFGGVFWDVPAFVLGDLDRIEVVRGPGGAAWGANAVNGVIDVVTLPADRTQGAWVQATVGTNHRGGAVRYGGRLGENGAWRVYALGDDFSATRAAAGGDFGDAWHRHRVGFRWDGQVGGDRWMWQAEWFDHRGDSRLLTPTRAAAGQPVLFDRGTRGHGGHLLGRWSRPRGTGEEASKVQVFADRGRYRQPQGGERRDTFDVEAQHAGRTGAHRWLVGGGWRWSRDNTERDLPVRFDPPGATTTIANLFGQDTWTLHRDRLDVTIGLKLEENSRAGFEAQPHVRLRWQPVADTVAWLSAGRAVRNPTRFENDILYDSLVQPAGALGAGTPVSVVRWIGEDNVRPEQLWAYEVGVRRTGARWSAEAVSFVHDYRRLSDIVPATAPVLVQDEFGPLLLVPYRYTDTLSGQSYGLESAARFDLAATAAVRGGYTFGRVVQSTRVPGINEDFFERTTPRQIAFVRLETQPRRNVECDVAVRSVTRSRWAQTPGYVALDLRVAWSPLPGWSVEALGENLTDAGRTEFLGGADPRSAAIRRTVHLRVTWER